MAGPLGALRLDKTLLLPTPVRSLALEASGRPSMDLVDRCGATMSKDMADEEAKREAAQRAATPRLALQRSSSIGKRVAATKARHVYHLNIGEKTHEVILDVSKLSGKTKLTVDGEQVQGFKRSHSRTLPGAHTLDVNVKWKYLQRRPAVVVDGMKLKRMPLHRPGSPAVPPPPPPPPPPLELAASGVSGRLADAARRVAVAEAVPATRRERTLDLVHTASEDGYDLDRALAKVGARLPALLVVDAGVFTIGLYVRRADSPDDGSWRRRACRVDFPWRRVAAPSRLVETGRGPAAAATVTLPWRRAAAPPRPQR